MNHNIPKGVIVAKVITSEAHPNADKLIVCKVDTGTEELQIICGAPNVKPGMKVALATIGTKIEDPIAPLSPIVIKKARLRGIESFGMLCSEKELGISDNDSGIMELSDIHEIGKELSEYYKN